MQRGTASAAPGGSNPHLHGLLMQASSCWHSGHSGHGGLVKGEEGAARYCVGGPGKSRGLLLQLQRIINLLQHLKVFAATDLSKKKSWLVTQCNGAERGSRTQNSGLKYTIQIIFFFQ